MNSKQQNVSKQKYLKLSFNYAYLEGLNNNIQNAKIIFKK